MVKIWEMGNESVCSCGKEYHFLEGKIVCFWRWGFLGKCEKVREFFERESEAKCRKVRGKWEREIGKTSRFIISSRCLLARLHVRVSLIWMNEFFFILNNWFFFLNISVLFFFTVFSLWFQNTNWWKKHLKFLLVSNENNSNSCPD